MEAIRRSRDILNYDTIAFKAVNASAVEIIEKKDGKVMFTNTGTVSSDGNTLNEKFTDSAEASRRQERSPPHE
jgi:hypothetical protein